MPSFVKSPTEILKRDAEQAQRLVQGVGHAKTLALLGRAQTELDARLKRAEGLGGPGRESFTAAQLRATLAQVRAVTTRLGVGMQGVVLDQGRQAAEHAAKSATQYLVAAERHFTGSTERLNLDTARIVDRAVAGTESSVLQRLLHGPDPKKRQGILQRYGENVVNHFEDRLQQRVIQRTPWAEVRDQLTEDSPFLQAAPGHWAERIVRTETMAQEGRASLESIQSADEQLGDACKIISSVFDSRTGADSFAVHGQIRRPNESFQSWFGSYIAPPDRPNDRSIVVPHRVSWPIPDSLKPKSDGAVSARWSAEGRKGSPPGRPRMTTILLELFGKQAPPKTPDASPTENPGSPSPPVISPLERRPRRAQAAVSERLERQEAAPAPRTPRARRARMAPAEVTRSTPEEFTAARIRVDTSTTTFNELHRASQHLFGVELTPSLVHDLLGLEQTGVPATYRAYPTDNGKGLDIDGYLDHPDGTRSRITREYSKHGNKLEVHHAFFKISETQKGSGIGKGVLARQVQQYDRLGVSKIVTEAAWDGQYVWPNMGFELRVPSHLPPIQTDFGRFLKRVYGMSPEAAERVARSSMSINELARATVDSRYPAEPIDADKYAGLKANETHKAGKRFLIERGNGGLGYQGMLELKVELDTPADATLRGYLGVPARKKR